MKRSVFQTLLFLIFVSSIQAEVSPDTSTGIEPLYSYKGGLNEAINVYTRNLNLNLPILTLKGRAGQDLVIAISYNSRQVHTWWDFSGFHAEPYWNDWSLGRWTTSFGPFHYEDRKVMTTDQYGVKWYRHEGEVGLDFGTRHFMAGEWDDYFYPPPQMRTKNTTDWQGMFSSKKIWMKDGSIYDMSVSNGGIGKDLKKIDPNGNFQYFDQDNSRPQSVTDNLGRVVQFYYEDPADSSRLTRMTALNHAGQTKTWTFEYETKNVGYYGIGDVSVLTRINLPDGTFWQFTYYVSPQGKCPLLLTRIDYPMGGYTRYEYESYLLNEPLSRKWTNANDGQGEMLTGYVRTSTPDTWITTVTAPDGSYQEYTFPKTGAIGQAQTVKTYASGGALAETVTNTLSILLGDDVYRVERQVVNRDNFQISDTKYTYDSVGNIVNVEMTDPEAGLPTGAFRGRKTTRSYQLFGTYSYRPTREIVYDLRKSQSDVQVARSNFYYDEYALTDRGTVTGHEDSYGTSYTVRGNLTRVSSWKDWRGQTIVSRLYYDTLGNVVQTYDPKNYLTTIAWSATFHHAYPTSVTNPRNHVSQASYSFYTGQVLTSTDPNNQVTTHTYDSLDRLTRTDFPIGYRRFDYDLTLNNASVNQYTAISSGVEAARTTWFDGVGREKRVRVSDPSGDVFVDKVYSVCDCLGKKARVSRPYRTGDPIYWTESRYDALGRPTQLIPPDGTETSNYLFYEYSQRNVTVTDPAGKKRKYKYDLLGRVSVVYEPDDSNNLTLQTAYSYPPNEMSIVQGAQMRTFLFDYLGRLTSETHPENGTTTYVYDNNGNRTQKTDARGIMTTTTYEKLNRPTQETYSDGTPTVTWAYDTGSLRKGRLYTVTNATAASTFTYNKMGQVTREDKTIEGIPFSLIRTYNLAGAQTSMTLPNGTKISNAYNSAGQLTQITSDWIDANHPAILATGFEYAPSGALTYLEYGNGTASSRSFNSSGQLKALQHGPLGDPGGFLDYRYNYNEGTANNGQIVSIDDFNDTTKSFTYTYDTLGRLKTAATTGTHWGLSWTYDRYGNRLSQSVTKGSAPSQSLSVSTTTNRVTTWTYDAAGNTLNDGQHNYSYDANHMITQLDAGAAVYKYDGQGNRVVKQTPTETIYYFFGVGEYSSGAWRKLYLFAGIEKLAEYSNGTTYFFHSDHLTTPRAQTDISGGIVETWTNFPFGEQWILTGGAGNEHRYTSKVRDFESGDDYFGLRYYSSTAGRWLAVDPAGASIYDPQRLNRYLYTVNDPINYIDPDGAEETPTFSVTVTFCLSCLILEVYEGFRRPLGYGYPHQTPPQPPDEADIRQNINDALRKMLKEHLTSDEFAADCKQILSAFDPNYLTEVDKLDFYIVAKGSVWNDLKLSWRHPDLLFGDMTLAEYLHYNDFHGVNGAAVVGGFDRDGTFHMTHTVLLGDRWLDTNQLKQLGLTQTLILVHELFHVISGQPDVALARQLGLRFRGEEDASRAITKFIKKGCRK